MTTTEQLATQALADLQGMGITPQAVIDMAVVAKAQAEGKPYLLAQMHEKHGLTWELHGPKHRAFFVTLDRLDAVVALIPQLKELHKQHSKTRPKTKLRKNS